MKTSSETYNIGIEIMKKAFGGTDILILSDLYRQEHANYSVGKLGADIRVEGKTAFMGYSEVEDLMVYGLHLAEEFIAKILKE